MAEGAVAHVGLEPVVGQVHQLAGEPVHLGQVLELGVGDAVDAELQLQVGDDRQ